MNNNQGGVDSILNYGSDKDCLVGKRKEKDESITTYSLINTSTSTETVSTHKTSNSFKLNPKAAQYQVPLSYAEKVVQGGMKQQQSQQLPMYQRQTNLEVSSINEKSTQTNAVSNYPQLAELLKQYIYKKCSLNDQCNSQDFDGTALESLTRLSFIQALQAVEHYGASVSDRIMKKPAYLMGIIRGQESHWDNSRAAAQLEGGALQLLHLPKKMLLMIGNFCLQGNCLPSDFTPEVVLSLHTLTIEFAMKAINAFDSNKRIVAGTNGGVNNRPRFLQRLIENVIQQNPITLELLAKTCIDKPAAAEPMKREQSRRSTASSDANSKYSSPKSFLSLLGSGNSATRSNGEASRSSQSSPELRLEMNDKIGFLERELTDRIERERRLKQELGNLKVQVGYWEKECHRLNSTITHILRNPNRVEM